MARIGRITRSSGSGKLHPTETDAEWSIVLADDGSRYLQIDTFGSAQRASHRKVSQTIQIGASEAKLIREAITTAFGPE